VTPRAISVEGAVRPEIAERLGWKRRGPGPAAQPLGLLA
jgi:hypothetical protein